MNQMFAVRQLCEKYQANGDRCILGVVDLEKASDTIDRQCMWKMLRVQGVGGKLLKVMQFLCR